MKKNSLAFVIPCLNEEKTLPFVLNKIQKIRKDELQNYHIEVILLD